MNSTNRLQSFTPARRSLWLSGTLAAIGLLLCVLGCANLADGPNHEGTTDAGAHQFDVQTKTSGCVAHDGLPDAGCTPGAIFPDATKDQICQSGYASSVRNVPTSEKDQAYAEYDIASHATGEYEVDHLVSLELGGSNDIANLWPEAANPTPGFHQKDQLENYLHDQVCSGAMSLSDAQVQIATNWFAVYKQIAH